MPVAPTARKPVAPRTKPPAAPKPVVVEPEPVEEAVEEITESAVTTEAQVANDDAQAGTASGPRLIWTDARLLALADAMVNHGKLTSADLVDYLVTRPEFAGVEHLVEAKRISTQIAALKKAAKAEGKAYPGLKRSGGAPIGRRRDFASVLAAITLPDLDLGGEDEAGEE